MSRANALKSTGFDVSGSVTGFLASVILHSALIIALAIGWTPQREERKIIRPRYIQAELLQLEPAVAEPAPPKEEKKPKVDEQAKRRAEEQQRQEQLEREQQAKAEAERKRQEQLKKEQLAKAEAEKKRQAEQKRELERQEQLKREQQAKAEAEKKRQEELRRQQMEQELANALAQEEAASEAQENLKRVGTYTDYMTGLIAANWSRPPSARRDMEVELEIMLGSAGRVTGVRVLKSSGNEAFDRSAEQAVLKVGQFSRLSEMDPALYQQHFRRLILVFRPEDLRM